MSMRNRKASFWMLSTQAKQWSWLPEWSYIRTDSWQAAGLPFQKCLWVRKRCLSRIDNIQNFLFRWCWLRFRETYGDGFCEVSYPPCSGLIVQQTWLHCPEFISANQLTAACVEHFAWLQWVRIIISNMTFAAVSSLDTSIISSAL